MTAIPRRIEQREQQKPKSHDPSALIYQRHTPELVLGLIGPVASGVSTTAELLRELLVDKFGYERVEIIKVSSLIEKFGKVDTSTLEKHERIRALQTAGNQLRTTRPTFIAEKCIELIALGRVDNGYEKIASGGLTKPSARRVAYIVDSLKHSAETSLFSDVYGETFWQFGIFAPEDVRKVRLSKSGVRDDRIDEIMLIDQGEDIDHGQHVRDTMHLSDFFVRNDESTHDRLVEVIRRYLNIIFNIGVNTPTKQELGMYTATSAASASACLSRQVGASIYSQKGELIGIGSNDVPKFGGGLYTAEDGSADKRCYKWGKKCYNDDEKEKLYVQVRKALQDNSLITANTSVDDVKNALRGTRIRDILEYSRAVHAEMDAIVSVARGEKAGLIGSAMYCTTYPCHQCARHIVASGITAVYYIEPYPKSLATRLHDDSVSIFSTEEKKVRFLQYEGVAPKNMVRLFQSGAKRKEGGKLLQRTAAVAMPIVPSPLDGFAYREQIVVDNLNAIKEVESSVDNLQR